MNCCDDAGRCQCGMGVDRPLQSRRRSCDELGLCQAQFGATRCASCDQPSEPVGLRLAPGVIQKALPSFDELARKRRRDSFRRTLKGLAWWFAFVLLAGLATGLIAGVNP